MAETTGVRDPTLHAILESFTADAAGQLTAETARGAEIPFELIEAGSNQRGRTALYCYRPLTADFIGERLGLLSGLPSYLPVLRALAERESLAEYLTTRGELRIPSEPRDRADAALSAFLSRVFAERTEFELDPERFEAAYQELEQALYEGKCVSTVIAPLLGLALESDEEIPIGEGLALAPAAALPDAPVEAVWGDAEQPHVLAVLRVTQERSASPPVSLARTRFRRILTAVRLFERGCYALGPSAWTRTDAGVWRAVAIGSSGRPGLVNRISCDQEDELRAFCNLIARRIPEAGELAWALARYEMGCERFGPLEGPESGRLAGRLAAICAPPDGRAALAERIASTVSLERAVITGLDFPETTVGASVRELSGHLRAILRDVLCRHLDTDLCGLADGLLGEAASAGV